MEKNKKIKKKIKKKPGGKEELKRLKKTSAIHYLVYDPGHTMLSGGGSHLDNQSDKSGYQDLGPKSTRVLVYRHCHRLRVAGLENHR